MSCAHPETDRRHRRLEKRDGRQGVCKAANGRCCRHNALHGLLQITLLLRAIRGHVLWRFSTAIMDSLLIGCSPWPWLPLREYHLFHRPLHHFDVRCPRRTGTPITSCCGDVVGEILLLVPLSAFAIAYSRAASTLLFYLCALVHCSCRHC